MSAKLLEDVTVVDVSSYVTGGFATAMLANQGAEVIKVERPGTGDQIRETGPPFVEDESAYFLSVNYGKQSIEVNLKDERGRQLVADLVEDADVFVENFRGSAAQLGLGYEELSARNEGLIYCSISAFGETGPWANRPGFDTLMQGLTGLMSVTGEEDGPPVKIGVPHTDLTTAMWAAYGIVCALHRRDLTGEGEHIELAMFDAVIPWLTMHAAKVFEGETPVRSGTKHPVAAPYQAFAARDGHIICGAPNQKLWTEFCRAIGREDLLEDDRFATNSDRVEHVDELEAEIESEFQNYTVEELFELMVDHELPAGPVYSVADALSTEQAEARGVVRTLEHQTIGPYPVLEHPLWLSKASSGFDRHAPVLGQDTDRILREQGYSAAEIDHLRQDGTIG